MNFLYFILDYLKKVDILFIILVLILQGIGLLTLYSAIHETYAENIILFKQQILWVTLGWIVFFIMSSMNLNFLSKVVWPLYWIHIVLLLFTLFFGENIFNTKRWIDLWFFNYQPSETLKLILVLCVAKKLSERKFRSPLDFKNLIIYSAFIVLPLILVLIQPDLGTTGILSLILIVMILFNGVQKRSFIGLVVILFISLPVVWNFILKPYQKTRITAFLQPEKDPKGSGYNVIQSKIAVGSGQLFGKGFGKGTQSRLKFLPERHTDFIFSVLSEEYGLFVNTIVLILFFILISYMFNLASLSRDRLSCYLCIGAGSFFLWHVLLNISMTIGLFPVVGAPLPLFSYGGSHTLTVMSFLGLIASINKKKDFFLTQIQ